MKIERWHLITALIAAVLLLLAVSIENFIEMDEAERTFAKAVFSYDSLIVFLTELSFALVIALAISTGIERQSRENDGRRHDNMRKAIAEDVFKGVFSQSLPPSYINAVIERNLKVRSVRTGMKAIEQLKEIDVSILGRDSPLRSLFVQVDRVLEYTLENISGQDITETASFDAPIDSAELIEHAKITKLVVDGQEIPAERVSDFRRLLKNNTHVLYEWPIHIKKGCKSVVVIESTLFKEPQDSDYWRMNYPTLRFELIMRSNMPLSKAGFLEHTSAPVTSRYVDAEKGIISCIIDGPMLPNDSMTYWWSVA